MNVAPACSGGVSSPARARAASRATSSSSSAGGLGVGVEHRRRHRRLRGLDHHADVDAGVELVAAVAVGAVDARERAQGPGAGRDEQRGGAAPLRLGARQQRAGVGVHGQLEVWDGGADLGAAARDRPAGAVGLLDGRLALQGLGGDADRWCAGNVHDAIQHIAARGRGINRLPVGVLPDGQELLGLQPGEVGPEPAHELGGVLGRPAPSRAAAPRRRRHDLDAVQRDGGRP